MAFTEFKTASQAIQSNDQAIDLVTEPPKEAVGEAEVNPEGPTSVAKASEPSKHDIEPSEVSVTTATTAAATTTAATAAGDEEQQETSTIDSSSNNLASQLSTSQHQQQQQQQQLQQLKKESAVKELVTNSQTFLRKFVNIYLLPTFYAKTSFSQHLGPIL